MTATLIESQTSGVLLKNIRWQTYESLVNELAEQAGIRFATAKCPSISGTEHKIFVRPVQ